MEHSLGDFDLLGLNKTSSKFSELSIKLITELFETDYNAYRSTMYENTYNNGINVTINNNIRDNNTDDHKSNHIDLDQFEKTESGKYKCIHHTG
jgi:hypothetical protein